MNLKSENMKYWEERAESYALVNRDELKDKEGKRWLEELECHICTADKHKIRILDIGTGPGFFAIILAKAGYRVTAVDFAREMLEQAAVNAGQLKNDIDFQKMEADHLLLPDESMDIIVTRNLTWNLSDPESAYREWKRVLKKGGMLLNYDANWYKYLFDEKAKSAYETDRMHALQANVADQNVGENFDKMEEIARQIPLSEAERPQWDLGVLRNMGMTAEADLNVWEKVWSDTEKICFASTPMFGIRAIRLD